MIMTRGHFIEFQLRRRCEDLPHCNDCNSLDWVWFLHDCRYDAVAFLRNHWDNTDLKNHILSPCLEAATQEGCKTKTMIMPLTRTNLCFQGSFALSQCYFTIQKYKIQNQYFAHFTRFIQKLNFFSMFRSAATQEGCKSIGRGHDFDNFNCTLPCVRVNSRTQLCQLWKPIVTRAKINCDWGPDCDGRDFWPDCDRMRLCWWWTPTGSSHWAELKNSPEMFSLAHQMRNVAARNVHLPTIVFSQTPL